MPVGNILEKIMNYENGDYENFLIFYVKQLQIANFDHKNFNLFWSWNAVFILIC